MRKQEYESLKVECESREINVHAQVHLNGSNDIHWKKLEHKSWLKSKTSIGK